MTDRVKHEVPPEDWPTAEEAAKSRWFSPVRIGAATVALQRTWIPAMVPWRATDEGFVSDAVIDWYGRFADGQPGTLVIEATGVRDVPSGPLLRIGHDRFLPGLARLVEAVRQRSHGKTRLLVQLIDFLAIRRRPDPEKFLRRFLVVDQGLRERLAEACADDALSSAPEDTVRDRLIEANTTQEGASQDGQGLISRVLSPRDLESLNYGYRERVTDTHLPHIESLPNALPPLFADAAERARSAGFDGVELHYAHAYTMASFLSKRNQRDDGYGGSREGRVRLPLEVFHAVRERVGASYPVGARFLGDEVIDGGSKIDDAAYYGVRFAKAGMDFLSVSKGGKFEDARQPKVGAAAYPYTGKSGQECMPTIHSDATGPFSRNVPLAAAIRQAVRDAGLETPVITAGGICGFHQAEKILADGDADIVASARQSLADPDWFRKILLGQGEHVRRCLFTNYCEALDQRHKEVTCQLWDRSFDSSDTGIRLTQDGRRRMTPPEYHP